MILSHKDLKKYWKSKQILFKPDIEENQISICSIDLRIADSVTRIKHNPGLKINPSRAVSSNLFDTYVCKPGEDIEIKPKELILGMTYEEVLLPNHLAAMIEGKSTFARYGLSAHVTAPLINPGWIGRITLELYNHSPNTIYLNPGETKVCQLILMKLSSRIPKKVVDALSRYRGQSTAIPQPLDSKQ